jgi:hypothetical protein
VNRGCSTPVAESGAKGCECGRQAACTDSRPYGPFTRRRYWCSCGARWSTLEVRAVRTGHGLRAPAAEAPIATRVTEVLRGLIQEINRT